MRSIRVRMFLIAAGLLAVSLPASAQYHRYGGGSGRDEFRLWVGWFQPDAGSDYWRGVSRDFTGSPSDFNNASFGVDYVLGLSPMNALIFDANYYEGSNTQSYRNFTDQTGARIRHDTRLGVGSFTVGYLFRPLGTDSRVVPYLGVGGGAYTYFLHETGDFIDFGNGNQVFNAGLRSSGTVLGFYGLVGVEVPISRRTAFFAEGRWNRARDTLKGDFEGLGKLDLSGTNVAAGISWKVR